MFIVALQKTRSTQKPTANNDKEEMDGRQIVSSQIGLASAQISIQGSELDKIVADVIGDTVLMTLEPITADTTRFMFGNQVSR